MSWRWAAASEIGTSHIRLGSRKQDAFSSFLVGETKDIFCGIVCDGAGSARFGGEGASLVCRTVGQALRAHFQRSNTFPDDETLWTWIDQARDALSTAAQRRAAERREFASTFILLLAAQDEQLVAHIGDGAVVGRDNTGVWETLSWPENGEYASTTYFISDDPAPKARISRFQNNMKDFALFSDGIESLALNSLAMIPHEPFFRTMISPLEKLDVDGKSVELSLALGAFLRGARVCEKTDDDKSLILVSRR